MSDPRPSRSSHPLAGLDPSALLRLGLEGAAAAPPLVVPGYTLLESLGRGGMGEVFRARQESLGREVAVKVLRADLRAIGWMPERFEHEASTMAVLRHPHLVAVHDCLRLDDGRLAIVMELVRGGTLRTHLTAAPDGLPLVVALRWVREVAEGLQAAHRFGIVHRDVKPENILIEESGPARVSDFGMALSAHLEATRYTQTGTALGTLGYMAPEQLRGGAADARTDVFSLGVVLYEMLTGRLPQGSFRHARELRSEVPEALDALIMAALRPEPEHRPTDMEVVLAALEHAASPTASRLTRRRWLVAGAGAAVAVGGGWLAFRRGFSPGETGVETPAATAPSPAASPAEISWRRLAWPAEPATAAISGGWRREEGWLLSDHRICILPLVQRMPEAWLVRLRFRRLSGRDCVALFFRNPHGVAVCALDGWSRAVGGVDSVGGRTLKTRGGFKLQLMNGRAYEWMIEIRPEIVRMWVDGEVRDEHPIANEPLMVPREWEWMPGPEAPALALASWQSPTRFEWIEWRPA